MRVLVACEESQEVCKAFRERGHEAYSCDLQDCSGGHPEWHIKGDVIPLLDGNCTFMTEGGGVAAHRRKVGFADSASAMHGPGRQRREMVSGETKGFPSTEVDCPVYADGPCTGRPDSGGKSCRYYVKLLPKTGSDHTAMAVRARGNKGNLLMVKRPSTVTTDKYCGRSGAKSMENATVKRQSKNA